MKIFSIIVLVCSVLVIIGGAVSAGGALSERDSGMKASIEGDWGFIEVGKDGNGRWEVVLENSVIRCRYGWKPINEDKGGESFITHLIIKENNQNQVGDEDSGGRIDAAAGRFEMLDASVKYDGTDFKTVQMSWKTQRPDFTASQAVTIFPDRPVLKVDYIKYCVILTHYSPKGICDTKL